MFVVDSDAFGGAEVHTSHLLRRLPPGIRRGLVVSEPVAPAFRSVPHVAERVAVPLARHRDSAPEVAAALARLEPDVVHVNLVDPASNAACLAAALDTAPTVATLHLTGHPGPDPSGLSALYGGLDRAVAPSAPIAAQLCELGVRPERVVRVRNGVDLPAEAARPPGRTPLLIGAVGRLTEQKGFDVLLGAVRRLVRGGRPLAVVVAGEGRDRARLERQAPGLPVTFIGHCADVPALLRRLDVFCLPSRREALSLALLEAMAHGLPCVTTAVGDVGPEVGEDALVVEPEDEVGLAAALDRLLGDPALRRALGERARRRALASFSAQRMADDYAGVIASAGAGHPMRAST
ncbi:glycosyltransferase family 4 protein [Spinactinospora alkalitolerans]